MQRPVILGRVIEPNGGARLHGVDDDARIDEMQLGDMRRLRESRGNLLAVAIMIIERDIVRRLVIDARRAGTVGLRHLGDGRQGLDVERDRLGGVLGLQGRLGDDKRHRIADETHFIAGQSRSRRLSHFRAIAILERDRAFERAVAREILAGVNAEHARHLSRRLNVDAANDSMRVRRAHDHAIGLAGKVDVVGIAALPLHQLGVFRARHRLADGEFGERPGIAPRDCLVLNAHAICGEVLNGGVRPQIASCAGRHKDGGDAIAFYS